MWALLGNLRVDRECAEERQENEDKRCDGRERARCDKRNTRLIAKCREVVDTRQTHDLPPRVGVLMFGLDILFGLKITFWNDVAI